MESSNGVPHPGSMQFFGLLHVEDGRRQSANLRHGDDAAAAIYLGNAVRLSNALAAVGCEFTLLTNDAARLGAIDAREFGSSIAMREIPFSAAVPPTAGFYSAHFKVDVFRWFAKLAPEGYPILFDVDAVALRVPPRTLRNCAAAGLPLVYDISDQVIPAYGEETIAADLALLSGSHSPICRWYGGEFIGGRPSFFARLGDEIATSWERYCQHFAGFHHQGDEILTSAALCRMIASGFPVLDAGPVGIVGRYWSIPPHHPQKPLAWFERCFLAHLPADKAFLARRANEPFDAARFCHAYRRHLALGTFRTAARQLAKRGLRVMGRGAGLNTDWRSAIPRPDKA